MQEATVFTETFYLNSEGNAVAVSVVTLLGFTTIGAHSFNEILKVTTYPNPFIPSLLLTSAIVLNKIIL